MLETYAWIKLNKSEEYRKQQKRYLQSEVKYFIFQATENYYGDLKGMFCITLHENDPWHDEAISDELGLDYNDYINVMKNNNAKIVPNIIEYAEDDIHHSTDSWFDDKTDAENAVKELEEIRRNKVMNHK